MGTVIWFNGVRIRVNDKDHNPPHVHCERGDATARYDILNLEWMDCEGFTRSDLRKLEEQILLDIDACLAEWRLLHEKE